MKRTITTSWDDGHPDDLRLSELLDKYNLKGTFYVPIKNKERETLSDKNIRKISKRHEIGAHSFNHVDLTQLTSKEVREEVSSCKAKLEEIIDEKVRMFCYPKGKYNEDIVEAVESVGYLGARTTKLYETRIENKFKMPVTVQAKNPTRSGVPDKKHYIMKVLKNPIKMKDAVMNYFGEDWYETAIKMLDRVEKNGGIWHLMGHSWQLKDEDWEKLEDLFKILNQKRNKFKILTNDEVVENL